MAHLVLDLVALDQTGLQNDVDKLVSLVLSWRRVRRRAVTDDLVVGLALIVPDCLDRGRRGRPASLLPDLRTPYSR